MGEAKGKRPEWSDTQRQHWENKVREAKKLQKKENEKRAANHESIYHHRIFIGPSFSRSGSLSNAKASDLTGSMNTSI